MPVDSVIHTLSLGYSPCPNDTFIFYAVVHRKIETGGLRYRETLLDVETLNQKALNAELDITKVSFHTYGYLRDRYALLSSGAALGHGCGPLIVARPGISVRDLRGKKIAIPGRLTTAHLLLRLFDPELAGHVLAMPFDLILDAVRSGAVDAGLIIHESRFTYPGYGLREVVDLGSWWEAETRLPIPLGCIIAKKSLGKEAITAIDTQIRESVRYALSHRQETEGYVKSHARELDDDVIRQHINLYVNEKTLDLGEQGKRAVEELFRRAEVRGLFTEHASPKGRRPACGDR